jgi:uncharacterized protein YvpB
MKKLKVPYHSQRNNKINPSGACNVTSFAMTFNYHGIKPLVAGTQLEDELYEYMTDNNLSRHDPYDLSYMANQYPGIKATFTPNGTFQDIIKSIDAGNPVILHGYFTRFGHIIVITGYDDKGFIVNDPWGEWHDWGYEDKSGADLHYSYNLIARLASPESIDNPQNLFVHSVASTAPKAKKK